MTGSVEQSALGFTDEEQVPPRDEVSVPELAAAWVAVWAGSALLPPTRMFKLGDTF